jgi:hypothetical protein
VRFGGREEGVRGDGKAYRLCGFALRDPDGPVTEENFHDEESLTFSTPEGTVTLAEYIYKRYGVRPKKNQKVLKAVFSTAKERRRHEQRMQNRPIHLLPEFCFGFGLTEQLAGDAGFKEDLKKILALTPRDRMDKANRYAGYVKEECAELFESLSITMSARPDEAVVENLPQPTIILDQVYISI